VSGRLDDATWKFILGFDPVVPRWGAPAVAARSARSARAARASAGRAAPLSARHPARRDEIPGGPLSPGGSRGAGATRR
jgi:hypothetical protein